MHACTCTYKLSQRDQAKELRVHCNSLGMKEGEGGGERKLRHA